MGKVITAFTMSLDGFISGPDHDIRRLFKWYFSGDTEVPLDNGRFMAKVYAPSAEIIQEWTTVSGALVTGRGDFDASNAWNGKSPLGVPTLIVTHQPPEKWVYEGSPFTFVTEGVERAIELAQQAAGEKAVLIGGSKIVRQALQAGLLDEIRIELAPILLGAGTRLFDLLDQPVDLELMRVVDTPSVTHLKYRVVK